MMPGRAHITAKLRLCATLSAGVAAAACVSPDAGGNGHLKAGDVLTWDFTGVGDPGGRSLWPSEEGMPERLRRGLSTVKEDGLLTATVDGPDPAFIWQFQTPMNAAGLIVDADFDQDAYLQAFWITARCKTYQEPCSSRANAAKGRHTVELMLPSADSLRELRLDLAEKTGHRVVIHRMLLPREGRFTFEWQAYPPAQSELADDALVVRSSKRDPWISTRIAPLPASTADTITLNLEAPAGARPQLFWQGSECPHFDERCSVVFDVADGGASSQSAALSGIDSWTGQIEQLRLDPGDGPGEYRLGRIALSGAQ